MGLWFLKRSAIADCPVAETAPFVFRIGQLVKGGLDLDQEQGEKLRLEESDLAQEVGIVDDDAMAVEFKRAGLFQGTQRATDGFGRGAQVGGDERARDGRPGKGWVVALLKQEAGKAGGDGAQGQIFDLQHEMAHARVEAMDDAESQLVMAGQGVLNGGGRDDPDGAVGDGNGAGGIGFAVEGGHIVEGVARAQEVEDVFAPVGKRFDRLDAALFENMETGGGLSGKKEKLAGYKKMAAGVGQQLVELSRCGARKVGMVAEDIT